MNSVFVSPAVSAVLEVRRFSHAAGTLTAHKKDGNGRNTKAHLNHTFEERKIDMKEWIECHE